MKRSSFLITAICFLCLLCSYDSTKDTCTPPANNEISVTDLIGSTEEVSYESLINEDMFEMSYESYIDENNPLQLKEGPYPNAAVAKPFKSVLVDGNDVAAPLNVWMYPVVNEGQYIGFINCDVRYLNKDEPTFYGGEGFAPILNDALKKGNIALFNTADGTYGIYDDNTIITLESDKEYTGTITFDIVNQGYNLITTESANEIIYKK